MGEWGGEVQERRWEAETPGVDDFPCRYSLAVKNKHNNGVHLLASSHPSQSGYYYGWLSALLTCSSASSGLPL